MAAPEIRVGRSLDDAGADFVAAWNAAEAGEMMARVDRLTFVDWATLCSVLTPERFDLVLQLRREPSSGVRDLAGTLGRTEKSVHGDILVLEVFGLVARAADGSLSVPFDRISSTIPLRREPPQADASSPVADGVGICCTCAKASRNAAPS